MKLLSSCQVRSSARSQDRRKEGKGLLRWRRLRKRVTKTIWTLSCLHRRWLRTINFGSVTSLQHPLLLLMCPISGRTSKRNLKRWSPGIVAFVQFEKSSIRSVSTSLLGKLRSIVLREATCSLESVMKSVCSKELCNNSTIVRLHMEWKRLSTQTSQKLRCTKGLRH